jgi:hypothetical protein
MKDGFVFGALADFVRFVVCEVERNGLYCKTIHDNIKNGS